MLFSSFNVFKESIPITNIDFESLTTATLTAYCYNAKAFVSSVLSTIIISSGVDGAQKIDVHIEPHIEPIEAHSTTIRIVGQDVLRILSILSNSRPAILNTKCIKQLTNEVKKQQQLQLIEYSPVVTTERTPLISC